MESFANVAVLSETLLRLNRSDRDLSRNDRSLTTTTSISNRTVSVLTRNVSVLNENVPSSNNKLLALSAIVALSNSTFLTLNWKLAVSYGNGAALNALVAAQNKKLQDLSLTFAALKLNSGNWICSSPLNKNNGVVVANQEQVDRLKQGVKGWNQWRKKKREVEIDLSDAVFIKANLSGANLSGANFSGAKLREADLSYSDLSYADLTEADLIKADLSHSICILASFSHAYLYQANLISADLREANFFGADLSKASLQGSQLFMANLALTQLDQAHLSEADLFMSILARADLSGASLSYSNLSRADLTGAILIATEALATDFTEAIFTEACLQDWNINSRTKLEKVECDYIYLRVDWYEEDEEIKGNFFERRPSDPNQKFAQGEFTKLFEKALHTIDLIFRSGVDWEALLISLEKLRVEAEGAELSIQAIENKNDGAFVVRVNVPPDADKATVETYLKQEYDLALKVLDEKYRYELKAKEIEIESYRRENTDIMRLAEWAINRPINVQTTATAESKSMSETFNTDLRGANVTNYANKLQDNARQQAILHNYAPEQRQTLAEAAAEIQQLLEQLSQTYPTTTQTEKMALVTKAVEEIEKNPTLKARVVGALKAGGVETLKELIDNPLVNVLLAALEGWQEAE